MPDYLETAPAAPDQDALVPGGVANIPSPLRRCPHLRWSPRKGLSPLVSPGERW